VAIAAGAGALALASACSNPDNEDVTPRADPAAAEAGGGGGERPIVRAADGFSLAPAPVVADPGPGGVLFAASGEVFARTGYAFPPAQSGDAAFVDGWQVTFTRLLTTLDKIVLADRPDAVPGDPSRTGSVVAEVDGPWAIDLSRSDPSDLPGQGAPGEQAVPIAALSSQNRNGDAPLATDGTRYAFGFDIVAASDRAKNVNVDAAGLADYEAMTKEGCAVLYVGVATFKGDKTDPACYPPAYRAWPDVVNFRLCFPSPSTYSNCQNPNNDPAAPFPNEEHQRGIALQTHKSVVAQITLHTDHPFWDSVLHESPPHFDAYAARVVGQGLDGGAIPTTTLELTKGVDYTAYTDALGNPLEWRYCMPPSTSAHAKLTGPMAFDSESVPHAIGGDPSSGLRDYYDFATYDQSTQGHLNSDGLCFVKRNYPAPR
jgi:hypothetical protein